jgi:uncharacterized protein YjbI with pentapeptide repeats/dsDNA-binding SOS-regulon protein
MVVQNNPLTLTLPPKIQSRVSDLAVNLINAVENDVQINPDSLLGYLTHLIRGEKPSQAKPNTLDWIGLLQTNQNQEEKKQIASLFILEHAPQYFTENQDKHSRDKYLESLLPQELADKEQRAELKATLAEWFDYLNDKNGDSVNLSNRTRHWIFNSVTDLGLRVLKDCPVPHPTLISQIDDIVKFRETQSVAGIQAEIQKEYAAKNPDLANFLVENIQIKKDNKGYSLDFPVLYDFLSNQFLAELLKGEESPLIADIMDGKNESVKLILKIAGEKLNREDFLKLLSRTDIEGNNALTIAIASNKEALKLLLKITEISLDSSDFLELLSPTDENKPNVLMRAISGHDDEMAEGILAVAKEKLDNWDLAELLSQADTEGNNALTIAIASNKEALELILKITEGDPLESENFLKLLSPSDKNKPNVLMRAISGHDDEMAERILAIAEDKLYNSHLAKLLSQTDIEGNNALTVAIASNKEALELILKIAEKKLDSGDFLELLSPTDENKRNVLMRAILGHDDEIAERILAVAKEKLNGFHLAKLLSPIDENNRNILMRAISDHDDEITERILAIAKDKLHEWHLFELLSQPEREGSNAVTIAIASNKKALELILKITEGVDVFQFFLFKLFSQADENNRNVLMRAISGHDDKIAEGILATVKENKFMLFQLLSQDDAEWNNALTIAIASNKKALELILKITEGSLGSSDFLELLSQTDENKPNVLMRAISDHDDEMAERILTTAKEKLDSDDFKKFLSQADTEGNNALTIAIASNKEALELILKITEGSLGSSDFLKLLSSTDENKPNVLMRAISDHDDEMAERILITAKEILDSDDFKKFISQSDAEANKKIEKLILNASLKMLKNGNPNVLAAANLTNTVLDGADLSNANLTNTVLYGASLVKTQLGGVYWEEGQPPLINNNTRFIPRDLDVIGSDVFPSSKLQSLINRDRNKAYYQESIEKIQKTFEGISPGVKEHILKNIGLFQRRSLEEILAYKDPNKKIIPTNTLPLLLPPDAPAVVIPDEQEINLAAGLIANDLIAGDTRLGYNLTLINQQVALKNLAKVSGNHTNKDFSKLEIILGGASFDQATLDSANFSGKDLSGAVFNECRLIKTDLSRAKLHNTTFNNCDLSEVKLSEAKMQGTTFHNCNLSRSIWEKALMDGVNMINCTIKDVDIKEMTSHDWLLNHCILENVNFKGSENSKGIFINQMGLINSIIVNSNIEGNTNFYNVEGIGSVLMINDPAEKLLNKDLTMSPLSYVNNSSIQIALEAVSQQGSIYSKAFQDIEEHGIHFGTVNLMDLSGLSQADIGYQPQRFIKGF